MSHSAKNSQYYFWSKQKTSLAEDIFNQNHATFLRQLNVNKLQLPNSKNQNRNASKQENQDYFFKIDPVMNQEGNLGDITSSGNSTEANLSEDENLRPVAGWNFSESE